MSFNLKKIKTEEFKNPPKSARPMVRWWWTGLDVNKEELIKEIQELDDAGFLGAEIQVFMIGTPRNLEKKDKERALRSHRFMQPYYYSCLKSILDEASKRDMIIDLTIGSSWPAGGTHITKEESLKTLLLGEMMIEGPFHYSGELPKFKTPPSLGFYDVNKLKGDIKLEAVVAVKPIREPGKINYNNIQTVQIERHSIIDITETVNKSRILEWDIPIANWQILAFYSCSSGTRPKSDCRSTLDKESLVLDHLSSKSVKKHLDLHIGEGKKYFGNHFGKTLRSIFTDSLELTSDWLWTDNFLKQFKKRRGYDLRKFLPVCFVPNRDNKFRNEIYKGDVPVFDFEDGSGERIRFDFELTISDLFCEKYVQTISQWAMKNKLKNRMQAYGIRIDTLKAYGLVDIPETEQLYAGGIIDFLKFIGSVSLLYEKPLITAESTVWNQRDYLTTPLKLKIAADRLFVSGVNQIIFHGFPYQNPLFPYPGYCAFSTPYIPKVLNYSSNLSRMNPFWKFFPLINNYITRCQLVMQHGITISNVAIFYPLFNYNDSVLKKEELVGGYLDETDVKLEKNQDGATLKEWEKLDSNDKWILFLISLIDILTNNGYYYTHTNEECILKSIVKDQKLIIGVGCFEVLILLNIEKISLGLTLKLEKLAKEGIQIIFLKKIPAKQNGFLNYEENDKKIEKVITNLLKYENVHFINDIYDIPRFLKEDLKIISGLQFEKEEKSIQYIQKKCKYTDYYFLRNSSNQSKKIVIKFPIHDKTPFIMDPWTGEIKQATQYEEQGSQIKMDLYFEPYSSKIIEFKKSRKELYVLKSPVKTEREDKNLISYIEKSSIFKINLSDGTKKIIDIGDYNLPFIFFDVWKLRTELRDYKGNSKKVTLDLKKLKDWRQIPELKHCSSKGIYSSKFFITESYFQEELRLVLSLGQVYDVAIVKLNGIEVKPLLICPYEIEISNQVKKGENMIEVEVIPTLRNHLVGYAKTGGKNWKHHRGKNLAPSGLLGPVVIKILRKVILASSK